MNINDLLEAEFDFNCDFEGDAVDYWDYSFTAKFKEDYEFTTNVPSDSNIEYLRENCKRILKATDFLEHR